MRSRQEKRRAERDVVFVHRARIAAGKRHAQCAHGALVGRAVQHFKKHIAGVLPEHFGEAVGVFAHP